MTHSVLRRRGREPRSSWRRETAVDRFDLGNSFTNFPDAVRAADEAIAVAAERPELTPPFDLRDKDEVALGFRFVSRDRDSRLDDEMLVIALGGATVLT